MFSMGGCVFVRAFVLAFVCASNVIVSVCVFGCIRHLVYADLCGVLGMAAPSSWDIRLMFAGQLKLGIVPFWYYWLSINFVLIIGWSMVCWQSQD